ncbi:unnamed protein product [Adineta steineri]|uniref:EGF-like domain-containing protein n=1 Tax=Adineta steineri TaxID=433720 RepID=A0A813VDN8_9BILA|nr:unnamed protein product [Adineta steineri]CAF0839450.1 unnamed protein product [Adineta steineri]CAF1100910.1 unnamed protein product [Adineta steineri]CAF3581001.1 unnamed protein product [Adineta steineri]CAF3834539.1 unnamed protein product [Adineta steineri]
MLTLTDNMCSIVLPGFCKNGGTCYVNNTIQYACRCPYSDMGDYCEKTSRTVTPIASATTTTTTTKQVGNCSQFPCKNGGRCFNTGNTYYCQCYAPYAGTNCENYTG